MNESLSKPASEPRLFHFALGIIFAVTLVRVIVLLVSPLELYPDEAQYWWWAQAPAFGYFSKPPMIAWIVWLTTAAFGNAEWAIRIASPLLHGLTSLLVFAIARRLFEGRVALLGALAYLTTPGASWSSGLMSTDVPLLFFWAAALYAYLCALDDEDWRWPVLCGAAIGLGLLAKYAMLYFLLGAAVAAVFDARARRLAASWRGVAILAIAAMLVGPNILWNAQHSFATVAHTGSNAAWGRARFNPLSLLSFFFGQFGVVGPLLMAGWLGALWRLAHSERDNGALLLAAFSAPPLALMLVQSFIVTANANWAATAYVAAVPMAVRELQRWGKVRPLHVSFALNGAAMLLLWVLLVSPAVGERIGLGNAFKREEGWRALGQQVAREGRRERYDAIAAVNRSILAELLYYAKPSATPIRAWTRGARPHDHFQMMIPLTRPAARVLVVVDPAEARGVLATFDSARDLGTVTIPVGGRHERATELYDARNFRGS